MEKYNNYLVKFIVIKKSKANTIVWDGYNWKSSSNGFTSNRKQLNIKAESPEDCRKKIRSKFGVNTQFISIKKIN